MTPDYDLADRARNFASKIVTKRVKKAGRDDWSADDVREAEELEATYIAQALERQRLLSR